MYETNKMQQIPLIDLNLVTDRQQYRDIVPKAVCTVKKCSWGWASLSPETFRVDLKRSINGICCILLVAYIVVLTMHGPTNIRFKNDLTDISTGDLQKDILVWFVLTKWNEKKSICDTSLSVICTEQRLLPCSKNNVLNIVQKSKIVREMEEGVNRYGIYEKLRL